MMMLTVLIWIRIFIDIQYILIKVKITQQNVEIVSDIYNIKA